MFKTQSLTRSVDRSRTALMPVLEQERTIMDVGKTHHWPFRVLGVAPVPGKPVYYKQWLLVPIAQDQSVIPARSLERVKAIYEGGGRPKTFVLMHEAPAQLPAPKDAPKLSQLEYRTRQLAEHSETIGQVAGVLVAVAVPVLAVVFGTGLLLTLGLLGGLMAVDPILIAITDVDVWIEIDRWNA